MMLLISTSTLAKTTRPREPSRVRSTDFVRFSGGVRRRKIENLNGLSGRNLYAYRAWRRDGGYTGEEIKPVTLHGDLATLRAFMWFCSDIDAVRDELPDMVQLPSVTGDGEVSESTLEPDRAEAILDYLDRFKYASRQHTVVLILWHTGCRVGALRALDLDDLDLDGDRPQADGPGIEFVHRPETDTPLKNKTRGERWNAISGYVADVIRDYIEGNRRDETDEYGRDPLFTTWNGRNSRSNLRDTVYRVTRPCWYGVECPHDRDPETCEATEHGYFSKCPSARSPHDIRSGRATYYSLADVDRRIVSDRMDASTDVLDKHYDRRSARRKSEQRRDYLPDSDP
jgi:integrase